MNQYYVIFDGIQEGPFSIEELKEKNLAPSTFVWTEGMDDWLPAKEIENLQGLLNRKPPPIPKQKPPALPIKVKKPIKVEAEISKKKEPIISEEGKVTVANETKAIFKLFTVAIIISVISFPVYYFGIYEANKFDNFDVDKEINMSYDVFSNGWTMTGISISEFPGGWMGPMEKGFVEYNIKRRRKFYTEKSWYGTLYTFLISFSVLVLFRFISKGAKWVQETSKE